MFYRLSVFPIEVPPLRERKEDIGALAQHFADLACAELRRKELRITQQQLASLQAHDWPGNVRELKNVIERAVILSSGKRLRLDLVLPTSAPAPVSAAVPGSDEFLTEEEFLQLEAANLRAALEAADWRVSGESGAAKLLGIKPSTLSYRMKRLGVEKSRGMDV